MQGPFLVIHPFLAHFNSDLSATVIVLLKTNLKLLLSLKTYVLGPSNRAQSLSLPMQVRSPECVHKSLLRVHICNNAFPQTVTSSDEQTWLLDLCWKVKVLGNICQWVVKVKSCSSVSTDISYATEPGIDNFRN